MARARTKLGRLNRPAFTLVEVLAAIAIVAIVLPSIMYGITASARLGASTKNRSMATMLAESKLNEVVVTKAWQGSEMSGNFGDLAPGYTWQATATQWPEDQYTLQVDVSVIWTVRNNEQQSVTVSTLVYTGQTSGGGLF